MRAAGRSNRTAVSVLRIRICPSTAPPDPTDRRRPCRCRRNERVAAWHRHPPRQRGRATASNADGATHRGRMSCGAQASPGRSEDRVWLRSSSSPADRPSTIRRASGSASASRQARKTATCENDWARADVAASTSGRLVSSTPGPGPPSEPCASETWNSVNGQAATRASRLSPAVCSVGRTSSGKAKRVSRASAGSSARVRNCRFRSATSRRMAGVRKPCPRTLPVGPPWPSGRRVIGLPLFVVRSDHICL